MGLDVRAVFLKSTENDNSFSVMTFYRRKDLGENACGNLVLMQTWKQWMKSRKEWWVDGWVVVLQGRSPRTLFGGRWD